MSTKPLTIVAHIIAKTEQIDLVKSELLKLIPPTHAEAGCIQYDMHQDNTDPGHFMFFEIWQNRELWQDHMESKHIAALLVATEGAVESVTIHEMTQQ